MSKFGKFAAVVSQENEVSILKFAAFLRFAVTKHKINLG